MTLLAPRMLCGDLGKPVPCAVPPGPIVVISSVEIRGGDGEIRGS